MSGVATTLWVLQIYDNDYYYTTTTIVTETDRQTDRQTHNRLLTSSASAMSFSCSIMLTAFFAAFSFSFA